MRDFLLSKNTNYPFELFDVQHLFLLLITILSFISIFIFRKKIVNINEKNFKIIRIIMILIIFFNMFIYRVSYIYYGVYNIRIHLSLYYCHIVNYIFVIVLIINHKKFYKLGYILSWIGALWGILFPQMSEGIDCFIFYSMFISHNLLAVFVTFIICKYKIKMNFFKDLKFFLVAICIILFTYLINYDFGTNYNEPNWYVLFKFNKIFRYIVLLFLGFIGYIFSYIINKIYVNKNKNYI